MRFIRAGFPLILLLVFTWALNRKWGTLPPLGAFIDPVNGWAANAEATDKDFTRNMHLPGLRQGVTISFEDRMVPHISAKDDHDLYFAQGYIHAYFRLWQMDLQTRAAGGRLSEVAGKRLAAYDDMQRRKGMTYGAEHSLQVMEAEPHTKQMLDAYRDGINAYISSLNYARLPLEYKLLDFRPEPWTNLRSALLLKYMADDLTGYTEDFPLTYLRDQLSPADLDLLFPEKNPGSKPVIPAGTQFEAASLQPPATPGDSVFVHFKSKPGIAFGKQESEIPGPQSESGIGSNNWAISGKYTSSGAPILCNDPHLGLNLPSLWFECQLTAPGINVYGVSLPGAPGVVIGFNDSLSWGFTNNYRDVKDFYRISPADADHYWFNGERLAYEKRVEQITVRDSASFIDTVRYTIQGPVMYDANHIDPAKTGEQYAMCWMAHRGTNELLALYHMNRAASYESFVTAIMDFKCPAQNFCYADRQGNIAMWGQGQFINKWKGQGKYVMEGNDSITLWGKDIPMMENPHVLNPLQGYVASANQTVTDSTYPYWYNGHFMELRSWEINNYLAQQLADDSPKNSIPMDMAFNAALQNNTYSWLLGMVDQRMAGGLPEGTQTALDGRIGAANNNTRYNYMLDAASEVATLYQVWWYFLYRDVWQDDFPNVPESLFPSAEATMQLLLNDTASRYFDNRKTPAKEDWRAIVLQSYEEANDSLVRLLRTVGSHQWYQVKNTTLQHLLRLPAFSYDHLKIGGWGNTINAVKGNHGPSWRMIAEMGRDSIKALGVYPGGQSGNPGSKYYGTFVSNWVEGKYYSLLFLPRDHTAKDSRIKYQLTLQPL